MSLKTVDLDKKHVWHPFTQAQTAPDPIAIQSAQGVELFTEDGKTVLDCISSWWTNLYGHTNPVISEAIYAQSQKLEHVIFAGFTHQPAAELSQKLAGLLPGGLNRVFFSDNGSTCVEVALKIAYQYQQNIGRGHATRFLAFDGGYHGDTFGAMAAGCGSGFFSQWQDLFFSVDQVPYPETWWDDEGVEAKEDACLAHLTSMIEHSYGPASLGSTYCAMILEPLVQGASGMRMVRPAFLKKLVDLLKSHKILVIFDEVMTGFGRTGDLFACLKADVEPDMICLSKGLTAGFLPMSVTVCQDYLYDAFLAPEFDKSFIHGHSFTANPLGCAAALAGLELLQATAPDRARIEATHQQKLADIDWPDQVVHRRLAGTIAALDLSVADSGYRSDVGGRLKKYYWENGLLIRPLGNVVYLLPPYCITEDQLQTAWAGLAEGIQTVCASQ